MKKMYLLFLILCSVNAIPAHDSHESSYKWKKDFYVIGATGSVISFLLTLNNISRYGIGKVKLGSYILPLAVDVIAFTNCVSGFRQLNAIQHLKEKNTKLNDRLLMQFRISQGAGESLEKPTAEELKHKVMEQHTSH